MRLGLLGPSQGHRQALEKAARFLRRELEAERVLYLGADGALDAMVRSWAEQLVGERAGQADLCQRATARCLDASAEEIDEYLAREQERARLRMFASLPDGPIRTVELLAGRVAVLIHDKAFLDEEDILPATWLVFGKNPQPLIKRIGRRWFLSPGSFPASGVMLLDDDEGALTVRTFSPDFQELLSERLEVGREVSLHVAGSS